MRSRISRTIHLSKDFDQRGAHSETLSSFIWKQFTHIESPRYFLSIQKQIIHVKNLRLEKKFLIHPLFFFFKFFMSDFRFTILSAASAKTIH